MNIITISVIYSYITSVLRISETLKASLNLYKVAMNGNAQQ